MFIKLAYTQLSRVKPIHARWLITLYDKLQNSEQLIVNDFKAASILETLDPQKDFGDEDPFKHLVKYCKTYIKNNVSKHCNVLTFRIYILGKRPKFVRN